MSLVWDWFLFIGFVISILGAELSKQIVHWGRWTPTIVFIALFGVCLAIFFWGKSRR